MDKHQARQLISQIIAEQERVLEAVSRLTGWINLKEEKFAGAAEKQPIPGDHGAREELRSAHRSLIEAAQAVLAGIGAAKRWLGHVR